MNFELRFSINREIDFFLKNYNDDMDDVRSIISDVCEAVEHDIEFIVEGFGQLSWPLDVFMDLPLFLEQLPENINKINLGKSTNIDFFEQGIERRIDLIPVGDSYECRCLSQTTWQPFPEVEYIKRERLLKILTKFKEDFLKLIFIVSPDLLLHPWLKRWSN